VRSRALARSERPEYVPRLHVFHRRGLTYLRLTIACSAHRSTLRSAQIFWVGFQVDESDLLTICLLHLANIGIRLKAWGARKKRHAYTSAFSTTSANTFHSTTCASLDREEKVTFDDPCYRKP
jgi:hypothetical protein